MKARKGIQELQKGEKLSGPKSKGLAITFHEPGDDGKPKVA